MTPMRVFLQTSMFTVTPMSNVDVPNFSAIAFLMSFRSSSCPRFSYPSFSGLASLVDTGVFSLQSHSSQMSHLIFIGWYAPVQMSTWVHEQDSTFQLPLPVSAESSQNTAGFSAPLHPPASSILNAHTRRMSTYNSTWSKETMMTLLEYGREG